MCLTGFDHGEYRRSPLSY